MKSTIITFSILFSLFAFKVNAAKPIEIKAGADLVSSYVWRGNCLAGTSIQPNISVRYAGFSIGAWGSSEIKHKGLKEVDLLATYQLQGFKIGITDYWCTGEQQIRYFKYSKNETSHIFEGNFTFTIPIEKFPLTIGWNTIFSGADYDNNGKHNFSTYVELDYPFKTKTVDMNATLGFTPWLSPAFINAGKGLKVCNVAVKASKEIKITDSFGLPLFTQLTFNPALEDVNFVFGFSFSL